MIPGHSHIAGRYETDDVASRWYLIETPLVADIIYPAESDLLRKINTIYT